MMLDFERATLPSASSLSASGSKQTDIWSNKLLYVLMISGT